jgi:integrase
VKPDLRTPNLDCAAAVVDVPKKPKTEFHTVYESARELCQSSLLRIDQGRALSHVFGIAASGRQHHQPATCCGSEAGSRSRRRRFAKCPELAAGISRVKGVKQLGFRSGNWLSAEQSSEVLQHAWGDSMRAKRDYAMLAMLFGCGFRRSELVGLELDEIQMRQGHWAVVDLIGKGGHIRTVPIPNWVKAALDQWTRAANVTEGKIFRAVARRVRCGAVASRRTLCGMWSGIAVRKRVWSILHHTTCAGLVRSYSTTGAVNLSRFNSYSGTHRCRLRNAISETSASHAGSKTDGEPDQGTRGRVGVGGLLDPAS